MNDSKQFRNYDSANDAVRENYMLARKHQTWSFVKRQIFKYSRLNQTKHIWDLLMDLDALIDVSDPDMEHPNMYHALQTAEALRRHNQPKWLQLTGLIHDLGKIMFKKGNDEEGTGKHKQWAMVGDTFMLGCPIPSSVVYPEFNRLHPDHHASCENTDESAAKQGSENAETRYTKGCGLNRMQCIWGHDEYLYRLLSHPKNKNRLPPEALYIIRYHSLYVYHTHGEYREYMDATDRAMLPILQHFNSYDLYSKSDERLDADDLKDYYVGLIHAFFDSPLLHY